MGKKVPLDILTQTHPSARLVAPLARILGSVQVVLYLLEVVNTLAVLHGQDAKGGFAQSLLLEMLLQHGQLIIVLLYASCDNHFKGMVLEVLDQFSCPNMYDKLEPRMQIPREYGHQSFEAEQLQRRAMEMSYRE